MEEITLEKIDIIRQRTNLSYKEAKELLEKNNGSIVDALIDYESTQKTFKQNVTDSGNEIIDTIKRIIEKGNVNRIKVKKDNKVLVDIPVNAAVIAGGIGMLYPVLLGIGALTAIASGVSIEIERPDGKVEVINDFIRENTCKAGDMVKDAAERTGEFVKDAANKTGEVMEDMAGKAGDIINNIKDDINKSNF